MNELEANAGKLIRMTKFISIGDIDVQAITNNVAFKKGQEHNFLVGKFDMIRCEVNYFYYFFSGKDRSADIISDIIAIKFQKTLSYFLKAIEINYKKYGLFEEYIPYGIQQSFVQYTRYLLHYFEVSPTSLDISFLNRYTEYFYQDEFNEYENSQRDKDVLTSIFNALSDFEKFINSIERNPEKVFRQEIPQYKPKFLIPGNGDNGIRIKFEGQISEEVVEGINYLVI